jgi:hypothetical protein
MPHHVHVQLPDGPHVCADYREPVIPAMRRYLVMTAMKKEPARETDVTEIRVWWAGHAQQSELCRLGRCHHD